MPLDPKNTNNGVDLNEIDVSKLALVDKENLLEDLGAKLRTVIKDTLQDATNEVLSEFKSAIGTSVNEQTSTIATASIPASSPTETPNKPSAETKPPTKEKTNADREQEFERLLKMEAATRKAISRMSALQQKKNKEGLKVNQGSGDMYSDAGRKYALKLDNLADIYQELDLTRLQKAEKELADIQEKVRLGTVGKENEILTNATVQLQQALAEETKRRTTALGKIGGFLQKENLNIISIIAGVTSRSPLAGLMTRYMLGVIKDHQQTKQKEKANELKIGDLRQQLPRPTPDAETGPIKIDDDTIFDQLSKAPAEVRQASLDDMLQSGQITTDQYEKHKLSLLPPGFVPTERPAPVLQQSPESVPSETPKAPARVFDIGEYGDRRPTPANDEDDIVRDDQGRPIRDWERYRKITPKKKQKDDEINAWIHFLGNTDRERRAKEHAEKLKQPIPANWDEELFGDFYAPPPDLKMFKQHENYENPIPFLRKKKTPAQVLEMPKPAAPVADTTPEKIAAQPSQIISTVDEEAILHPEREPERISVADQMKALSEAQRSKVEVMGSGDGPTDMLDKLVRLNEQQLDELKTINKHLEKQIVQADLANDAALRNKEDDDSVGSVRPDAVKKQKEGGLFKWLSTALGIGGGGIGGLIAGKLKGILGIGKGGWLSNLFGAGKTEGVVGEAASAMKSSGRISRMMGKIPGVAKVSEFFSGMFPMFEKIGAFFTKLPGVNKLMGLLKGGGGVARLLGKLALPITAIMSIVDFISGFINAEKFFEVGKKLNMGDRIGAGLGNVFKNLVGIVDFVLGLVGIKSDLGGFVGKNFTKIFSTAWKVIKAIFTPFMFIGEKLVGLINEIPWDKIGGWIETAVDFIYNAATFLENAVNSFFENPGEMFSKALTSITDAISGGISSIGTFLWDFFSFENFKKAYEVLKTGVSDAISAIGNTIKELLSPSQFQFLVDAIEAIKKFIAAPFEWLSEKLGMKNVATKASNTAKEASSWIGNKASSVSDWFKNAVTRTPQTPPQQSLAPTSVVRSQPISSVSTPNTAPAPSTNAPVPVSSFKEAPTTTPTRPVAETSNVPQQISGATQNLYTPESIGGQSNKIQYKPGVVPPEIADMAKRAEAKTGVPAAVQIAQWALESGWGKHSIGNNVFGMTKAKRHTMFQTKMTNEDMTMREFARLSPEEKATAVTLSGAPLPSHWTGKLRMKMRRKFADYGSIEDSFVDHARLLANPNGPYAAAMAQYKKTGDVNQYIEQIAPTYATDRNYAKSVKGLVNQKSVVTALRNTPSPVPAGASPITPAPPPVMTASAMPPNVTPATPPSPGLRLAAASTRQSSLHRAAAVAQAANPSNGNVVFAPSSVTNKNETHIVDLKATNRETTYQRNMNSQYVPT